VRDTSFAFKLTLTVASRGQPWGCEAQPGQWCALPFLLLQKRPFHGKGASVGHGDLLTIDCEQHDLHRLALELTHILDQWDSSTGNYTQTITRDGDVIAQLDRCRLLRCLRRRHDLMMLYSVWWLRSKLLHRSGMPYPSDRCHPSAHVPQHYHYSSSRRPALRIDLKPKPFYQHRDIFPGWR
jgi:hypothetical protein